MYVHLGSICSVASGLTMPLSTNNWQKGVFSRGVQEGSINPLINKHYKDGSLVFHEYNKFLQDISHHMCLGNGDPTTLSHFQGRAMQHNGDLVKTTTPEWAMAIAQLESIKNNTSQRVITKASSV